MQIFFIKTNLGDIAIYQNEVNDDKTPIMFLHGVYFDHKMWDYQVEHITNRKLIILDMPLHGESKQNVPKKWTLQECGEMLFDWLLQYTF